MSKEAVKKLMGLGDNDFLSLQLVAERMISEQRAIGQGLLSKAGLIVEELGNKIEELGCDFEVGDLIIRKDLASTIKIEVGNSLVLEGNGLNLSRYVPGSWQDRLTNHYIRATSLRNQKEREKAAKEFINKLEPWGLTLGDLVDVDTKGETS